MIKPSIGVVIKPTIGRVVWFYPAIRHPDDQPFAAMITGVWGDRCVNLAVFERNGVPMSHPPTSVPLVQGGDPIPATGFYCTWMPYQIGRVEAVEGRPPGPPDPPRPATQREFG